MRRALTRVFAVTAVCAVVALISVPAALAHAERVIGKKKWHVEIGWLVEPAFAGYPNAVQFILHDAKDKPVVDLGDTLQVEVSSGGKTAARSLAPAFEVGGDGTPGDYHADLIPTRPGTYTFRVHGTIKGDAVNVSVTCSEKTFDCVKAASDAEFPAQDPSNGDLATRINAEATRLAGLSKKASDSASTGRTFGIVGVALGAAALVLTVARGRSARGRG